MGAYGHAIWRTSWRYGLVGIGALVLLLAVEIATEDEGMTTADLVLEALELALILVAASAATLAVHGTRTRSEFGDAIADAIRRDHPE